MLPYPVRRLMLASRLTMAQEGLHSNVSLFPNRIVIYMVSPRDERSTRSPSSANKLTVNGTLEELSLSPFTDRSQGRASSKVGRKGQYK